MERLLNACMLLGKSHFGGNPSKDVTIKRTPTIGELSTGLS